MSTLHTMKKQIAKNTLRFPIDMYNNVLGSLVITCYMFEPDETKPDMKEIRKTWKDLKRKGCTYWIDDADFIQKTAGTFHLSVPYDKFAMVQSQYNVLFAPYVDGQVYPIREDGFMGVTLKTGKVYPITTNKGED